MSAAEPTFYFARVLLTFPPSLPPFYKVLLACRRTGDAEGMYQALRVLRSKGWGLRAERGLYQAALTACYCEGDDEMGRGLRYVCPPFFPPSLLSSCVSLLCPSVPYPSSGTHNASFPPFPPSLLSPLFLKRGSLPVARDGGRRGRRGGGARCQVGSAHQQEGGSEGGRGGGRRGGRDDEEDDQEADEGGGRGDGCCALFFFYPRRRGGRGRRRDGAGGCGDLRTKDADVRRGVRKKEGGMFDWGVYCARVR